MDLETFSVIEAMSAGSWHVLGHRKHLVLNIDRKMLLRSWGQLVSVSNALLLSQRGSHLGWGHCSRMSSNAVHIVLAPHLSICSSSW